MSNSLALYSSLDFLSGNLNFKDSMQCGWLIRDFSLSLIPPLRSLNGALVVLISSPGRRA